MNIETFRDGWGCSKDQGMLVKPNRGKASEALTTKESSEILRTTSLYETVLVLRGYRPSPIRQAPK